MSHIIGKGRLEIIIGCMFSGKTSLLIGKLTQFADLGMKVLYINHAIDTRSEKNFSTHSSIFTNVGNNVLGLIECIKINTFDSFTIPDTYDVIGIDEAQFFDSSLIRFVLDLVESQNKHVLVCGLDSNFKREKFGMLLDLIPYADTVTKTTAVCKRCLKTKKIYTPGLFTKRIVSQSDGVLVGGANAYEPLCRSCYLFEPSPLPSFAEYGC